MGFFSRRHQPDHRPSQAQTTALAKPPSRASQPSPPQHLSPYAVPGYDEQPYLSKSGFLSEQNSDAIQQTIVQDAVIDQFSNIISSIDEDQYNENGDDFAINLTEPPTDAVECLSASRAIVPTRRSFDRRRPAPTKTKKITIWSKVSHYSNSRLPADLPKLKVYIPTWPLICLAAQYSKSVYRIPQSSQERGVFVSADTKLGTKAMVMKSVPCDDKKTLVFAIRGTSRYSLRDWNVNLNLRPESPAGFLDDAGNLCHSGFLKVAKAMVKSIAMSLRTLLEENPSRASCSLLITGHSAGGAVAALIYSHMLSSVQSELSILTNCFKRVHCITFGAPPVTLLPLTKPTDPRHRKSLFFSFMNEGDPIVRADRTYLKSLVDLLSSPSPRLKPSQRDSSPNRSLVRLPQSISNLDLTQPRPNNISLQPTPSSDLTNIRPKQSRWNFSQQNLAVPAPATSLAPPSHYWPVPATTLSNAGRLVIMRVPHQHIQSRQKSDPQQITSIRWEQDNLSKVTAHTVTDEQLRRVIFGDPSVHHMEVYLRRIDMLALKAVTARN